ncbi:hypothetical protein ZIOFF_045924 [Zingiber officinale]|uniref:Protein phosphatase n=1 Tax=Zingiber officinale TaxID=94328 RepID=A0A8J5FZD2_ZINOF|nr:hypothetical protein ZIOFF_045924 [Zingiber officinale]
MGRLSILRSLRLLPSPSPLRPSSIRQSRRLSAFARRQIRSELSLSFGSHLIPHPAKVDKGGEDAFLVSNHNGGVFAVADGVSGWALMIDSWADQNVDPALFSRELMANVSELIVDEEVCSLELIEGDTVVMGSDGLFDNIFDHEIISALSGSQDVSEAGGKLDDITVIVGRVIRISLSDNNEQEEIASSTF